MNNAIAKHEKQEAEDSKKELQLTAAMEELSSDIEELRNAIAHIASYYDSITESDLTDEVAKELWQS